MEIIVRKATAADAEGAAAVYAASAEHHHALDPSVYRVPPLEAVIARYKERLPESDGDSVLLVAEVGKDIIGTCLVALLPDPSEASMLIHARAAEIDVAVLPEFRGRGVGQILMTHGEQWAGKRGVQRMLLNAHAENIDAIRFYTQRLRYRHVGVFFSQGDQAGRSDVTGVSSRLANRNDLQRLRFRVKATASDRHHGLPRVTTPNHTRMRPSSMTTTAPSSSSVHIR